MDPQVSKCHDHFTIIYLTRIRRHHQDCFKFDTEMTFWLLGDFRCGPCPVKAIKEGNLGVKYDAPFVFAEVNADIIHWMLRKDGQHQKVAPPRFPSRKPRTHFIENDEPLLFTDQSGPVQHRQEHQHQECFWQSQRWCHSTIQISWRLAKNYSCFNMDKQITHIFRMN